MPFIQQLKKQLESGEPVDTVFTRELGFDEEKVLKEMIPGLKSTVPKLIKVDIVLVDEGAKGGVKLTDGARERLEKLPLVAAAAEPGSPSFEFINL